jgi:hypothetical protein
MVSQSTNESEQAVSQPSETAGADAKPSPGPDRFWSIAAAFCEWLMRPRVRLTITGIVLLLIGGLLVTSSVWTLPLVIGGALMVAIAWIGRRLDGRFAVEWGETGTQLEFRAQIKAAPPTPSELTATYSASRGMLPSPEHADVIEGEAHTVEIDVAELKALIAAAETTEAEIAHVDPAGADTAALATRNLRVAQGGGRASEAAG